MHFVGETDMSQVECNDIKRAMQFVGFLIFKILSEQDHQCCPFTVNRHRKYNRTVVKLFRNGELIFAMFEDYRGDWIIKLIGTKLDLEDFVIEYTIRLL